MQNIEEGLTTNIQPRKGVDGGLCWLVRVWFNGQLRDEQIVRTGELPARLAQMSAIPIANMSGMGERLQHNAATLLGQLGLGSLLGGGNSDG